MDEGNVEGARRRRLPLWMFGATANPTASTSAAVVDEDEKKTNTVEPEEEKTNLHRNSFAPRTRTKRSKKRKAKGASFRNPKEINTHDDDAAGLTVDDLVSIAQEYVKVNQNSESKQPLNRKCESQGHHPTISSSSNDLEGPLFTTSNEQRFSSNETTASCSSTMTSEQSLINVNSTGDPAQVMLDLFLGPLLKKPPPEDEKRSGLFSKDMDLVFESRKQRQNDGGEEIVPVTKKKSSLKDKVSLLLD